VNRQCRVCHDLFVVSAEHHPDCDICVRCEIDYENSLEESNAN